MSYKKWNTEEERKQARRRAVQKYRDSWNEEAYYKYQRNKFLKRRFGIFLDEYENMWVSQKGRCAICGNEESFTRAGGRKTLSVDHNHKTGKVRELLCYRCNVMLGSSLESLEVLMKAIDYLRKHDA